MEDATVIKTFEGISVLNWLGDEENGDIYIAVELGSEEADEVAATDSATEVDKPGTLTLKLSFSLDAIEEVNKIAAEDEIPVEEIWVPLVELNCTVDEISELLEDIAGDGPSVEEIGRLIVELSCPLDDIEGLVFDEGGISVLELNEELDTKRDGDEEAWELNVGLDGIEALEGMDKAILGVVSALDGIVAEEGVM